VVKSFVRVLAVVLALTVAAIGIVSSISALSGGPPLWPAALDIEPGTPDQSKPFDVPITVRNPSVLFDAIDVQFACAMVEIVDENGGTVERSLITGTGPTTIEARNARPFRCSFPLEPNGITSAQIRINASHQFWPIPSWPIPTSGGPFFWDTVSQPNRWFKKPIGPT
jgi:hypothetical protein